MINIKDHEFINVVQTTAVMKAIRISGYNLKLVYTYLEEQGCEELPDERFQAGHIWIFDPESKRCVTMTEEEFNILFTNTLKIESI